METDWSQPSPWRAVKKGGWILEPVEVPKQEAEVVVLSCVVCVRSVLLVLGLWEATEGGAVVRAELSF